MKLVSTEGHWWHACFGCLSCHCYECSIPTITCFRKVQYGQTLPVQYCFTLTTPSLTVFVCTCAMDTAEATSQMAMGRTVDGSQAAVAVSRPSTVTSISTSALSTTPPSQPGSQSSAAPPSPTTTSAHPHLSPQPHHQGCRLAILQATNNSRWTGSPQGSPKWMS